MEWVEGWGIVMGIPKGYMYEIPFQHRLCIYIHSVYVHTFVQMYVLDTYVTLYFPLQGGKCIIAGVFLFGVIPLLLGVLCDVMIFVPIRVPLDRTPVYFWSTVS